MKLKPLFKPALKQKKKTVKTTRQPLKEQIEKFDCMPDNYDGDTDYENISSSDETFIEE